jgi:cytochrome c-type biogenesis protein
MSPELLVLSLIAGVLTVLAPCILPLLPVIIGSSSGARSKATPYIVIASLGASILVFTYLLRATTTLITIPSYVWTYLSGGILVVFGLILAFPALWDKVPGIAKLSAQSNQLVGAGHQKQSVWGDVIIGAALGPVFSTCSPTYFVILATVLPESFVVGTIYLLAYIAGLSAILLLIALLGQKFADRLTNVADSKGWFKRGIGVLFVLVGFAVMTGFDKQIEIWLLDAGIYDISRFENQLLEEALAE